MEFDFEALLQAVENKEQLELRCLAASIKQRELDSLLRGESSTDIAINQNEEIAKVADAIVERKSFSRRFCDFYREHQRFVRTVDGIADIVARVLKLTHPFLEPTSVLMAVSCLAGIRIFRQGIDLYCSATS